MLTHIFSLSGRTSFLNSEQTDINYFSQLQLLIIIDK